MHGIIYVQKEVIEVFMYAGPVGTNSHPDEIRDSDGDEDDDESDDALFSENVSLYMCVHLRMYELNAYACMICVFGMHV
jgi:hypothetical protein